jgi:trans-aconitate methyltransferase
MTSTIIEHFNKKATTYHGFWQHWPFSALRGSEAKAILSLLDDLSGQHIAEFGCGSGYYTRFLLQKKCSPYISH